jgi:hypothetical protein
MRFFVEFLVFFDFCHMRRNDESQALSGQATQQGATTAVDDDYDLNVLFLDTIPASLESSSSLLGLIHLSSSSSEESGDDDRIEDSSDDSPETDDNDGSNHGDNPAHEDAKSTRTKDKKRKKVNAENSRNSRISLKEAEFLCKRLMIGRKKKK